MKIKIIRAMTPYNGEIKKAEVNTQKNGKTYLEMKEGKKKTKILLPEDVKPFTLETPSIIPSQTKKQLIYFMAGDNFMNIHQDHFKLTGKITNQMLSDVTDMAAIEALVRGTRDEGILQGAGGIILILVLVAGGLWILSQIMGNLPAIAFPF